MSNSQEMMTKFLFIVDHFVPFPQSEYGGIWNVIADGDEECFDLIVDADSGLNGQYYNKLRENVGKAVACELAGEFDSQIVAEFLT